MYEQLRPRLFSIAYRILGSVSEAEDIVHEAFLRFHRTSAEGVDIDAPRAYLTAVTTRLCIDHLRSARARRERYVGPWLPEPLVGEVVEDAAKRVEAEDSLSMAFLVVLECLSPVERAVFLLRDVFDYDFKEIALIVGKSTENCRQIAVRARRRVRERRPRFQVPAQRRQELARRFLAACEEGDTDGLVRLLAADVVVYADGGGKAPALGKPLVGRERGARLLLGLFTQARRIGLQLQWTTVNGQPGLTATDRASRIVGVLALDIGDGLVRGAYSVVNPDKLRHLGPTGDLGRLLSASPAGARAFKPVRRDGPDGSGAGAAANG